MWNQRQHVRGLGENRERVPLPKARFWIYHLRGVTDASLDLRNAQPNAKVLPDGTRCNGSVPGEEGGEVGSCCVSLESRFTSLSWSFFLKLK